MKVFRFPAMDIGRFGSRFSMTHILRIDSGVQAGWAQLPPGGLIGRHRAAGNQLLLVVAGQARVSGDDDAPRTVCAGEGAYWTQGEEHETSSKDGMMAFVLEGPGVDPANFLPGAQPI
jgi:quercetin dioxygenase-like cupin family protein